MSRQPARGADELLDNAGVDVPPVTVDHLARACGVLVIASTMPHDLSGLVFEMAHGAVIGVTDRHSENRQRFSIARELGHHLLSHHDRFHVDVTEGDPRRL